MISSFNVLIFFLNCSNTFGQVAYCQSCLEENVLIIFNLDNVFYHILITETRKSLVVQCWISSWDDARRGWKWNQSMASYILENYGDISSSISIWLIIFLVISSKVKILEQYFTFHIHFPKHHVQELHIILIIWALTNV